VIICDPPTSAHGGDGWILRRDYQPLLSLACARLAPGGLLVACVNTLGGKPFPLSQAIKAASDAVGVAVRSEAGFQLGIDIPQRDGFPEGRPYRLQAVRAGL
jgi:23S rRNA G2069 N7-methylase RlmK/C1962 C5-methylase RlmI